MTMNRKDVAAGAIFVAVGLVYGGIAWKSLPIGRALQMGPGYFPMLLSGLLIVLGSATLIRGLSTPGNSRFGVVPWRALVMLSLATVIFATFLRELGLFLAVVASTMVAQLSSPQIKVTTAAVVSVVIAAFCVGIFSYGINLSIPILGSWFVN